MITPAPEATAESIHQHATPLLEVRDLKVHFPVRHGSWLRPQQGWIRAVDGVSFAVGPGETLGIVGESGCGKSTMAKAIVNLLRPTSGEILFEGKRIDDLSSQQMLPIRSDVQMIFQDPFASLNPRMTVGNIIAEPMHIFGLHPPKRRKLEVMRLMDLVGLDPKFLNRYPHEFSGGQRQRIGIARALAVQPKLIICDEPVSALDVSIQAQVINLLMDLQAQLGVAYVFIAHDLAVMRQITARVGVMYLGRLVELAASQQLYTAAKHPYTQALLSAAPIPDPVATAGLQRIKLEGEVPSPDQVYSGCPFSDRCPIVEDSCCARIPQLEGNDHRVACFKA
jgi:oligopeptide transport system ATP-binding protein